MSDDLEHQNAELLQALRAIKMVWETYEPETSRAFVMFCIAEKVLAEYDRPLATSLRYRAMTAWDKGETRHPQAVMQSLGIEYQIATPQSMADQWWFWNCTNIPEVLPAFLEVLNVTPHRAIGNGLSREDADALVSGKI